MKNGAQVIVSKKSKQDEEVKKLVDEYEERRRRREEKKSNLNLKNNKVFSSKTVKAREWAEKQNWYERIDDW